MFYNIGPWTQTANLRMTRVFYHNWQLLAIAILPNVYKEMGYSSALFTFLIGWHANAVSLLPGDVTFACLAYPTNDVIFCLHW
jgi:hypothetical protein